MMGCTFSGSDLIRPSGTFSSQEKAMGTDCHTSAAALVRNDNVSFGLLDTLTYLSGF